MEYAGGILFIHPRLGFGIDLYMTFDILGNPEKAQRLADAAIALWRSDGAVWPDDSTCKEFAPPD